MLRVSHAAMQITVPKDSHGSVIQDFGERYALQGKGALHL